LSIPCLTLRENTERPVTVDQGTNCLVGLNPSRIVEESLKVLAGRIRKGAIPDLWDGRAAQRIVQRILEFDRN
jgi:UDP-N-acetylglucosamine 2-epimerase (non-hydrolysing)